MAKPKLSVIPKAVVPTAINNTDNNDLEKKLNDHIEDNDIHLNNDIKDAVTYLRKDMDKHVSDENEHVTNRDKSNWNSKETPAGAQAKVNKVLNSLEAHKVDYNSHITKAEKDLLKDKYTKAETRNLLKHTLTGLTFLAPVNTISHISIKYPNPVFNSCVYAKLEKTTYIYNGREWVIFDGIFTPEVTNKFNGLMTYEDKIKLDSIEEGSNNYIHPDNVDVRHVSDSQIDYWNKKADSNLVSNLEDGLMTKEDKIKLDSIEEGSNNYIHPDKHYPSIIEEDETHRFVSDIEKSKWNNKAEIAYVDKSDAKVLSAAKAFTDSKIASMLNTTEEQLQVLRSLSFELKKDDVVKNFFDLYNECAKNKELQDHTINSSIHMSRTDRTLLNDVKKIFQSGVNPDWKETDPVSLRYIENKPESLPANGGNADTVGGYTAEQLLNKNNFYDYNISKVEDIDTMINFINKNKGYTVLVKPGSYSVEKELIIKASNSTFTGIGTVSKLLGVTIKIIGNNNTIENITLANGKDNIVNGIAIYVEGNDNIIRNNTVMNYDKGIIVEGSNNIIKNNTLVNIRKDSIKLTSDINANYGNIVEENIVKNSNIGITLLSSKNPLTKNHIVKNKVLTCNIGITLSNTLSDKTKTIQNIISENIVMRGRGNVSDYMPTQKTIISEFSSKNIISSNITSGKEIIAPNDTLFNNIF